MATRVNARLSGPLDAYVDLMVGENGLYETPSEYIRDLLRRSMERRATHPEQDAILEGYQDLAAGRAFTSSEDFETDMKTITHKQTNG